MGIKFVTASPKLLEINTFEQVCNLIKLGGEVDNNGLEKRLRTVHLVGLLLHGDVVVGVTIVKPEEFNRDANSGSHR